MARRYVATAVLTLDERTRVKQLATRRGLTVSALVRRAINNLLLDEGEATELLEEPYTRDRRRKPRHAA